MFCDEILSLQPLIMTVTAATHWGISNLICVGAAAAVVGNSALSVVAAQLRLFQAGGGTE